jgi:hypothetical protein
MRAKPPTVRDDCFSCLVERTKSLQQFATPKLRNRAFWRQIDKSINPQHGVMVMRRLYVFMRSLRKAVTYS